MPEKIRKYRRSYEVNDFQRTKTQSKKKPLQQHLIRVVIFFGAQNVCNVHEEEEEVEGEEKESNRVYRNYRKRRHDMLNMGES